MDQRHPVIALSYSESSSQFAPPRWLYFAGLACGLLPLLLAILWFVAVSNRPDLSVVRNAGPIVAATLVPIALGFVAAFWYHAKAHSYAAGRVHYCRIARWLLWVLLFCAVGVFAVGVSGIEKISGPPLSRDPPGYRFVVINSLGSPVHVRLGSGNNAILLNLDVDETSHAIPLQISGNRLYVQYSRPHSRQIDVRGFDPANLDPAATYKIELWGSNAEITHASLPRSRRFRPPTRATRSTGMPASSNPR